MRVERGMERGGRAMLNYSSGFGRKGVKHFVGGTVSPFPKFLTD